MRYSKEDIKSRLNLGEDSHWEFKQVEFDGDTMRAPHRDGLARELAAFANTTGGTLLCGVTDDGQVQGMSRSQMEILEGILYEVCEDSIKPPLGDVEISRMSIDDKSMVCIVVPPGYASHKSPGGYYRRIGSSTREMDSDTQLRLAQQRGQARFVSVDSQPVQGTGFETLNERLWKPLISTAQTIEPRAALEKIRLLVPDANGTHRATMAGVLLCTDAPEEWNPGAVIMATCYRGCDRSSRQLDAREIKGPLPQQIKEALQFVLRNMLTASRKNPARTDMPQYSEEAVFEALVNAVAHRDYSIRSKNIRLSMFEDRLEIDSPGTLFNGTTIENIESCQSTRNEIIAHIFSRQKVGDLPGSENRQFLMEKRGDGVPIIRRMTREIAGRYPAYRLEGANLVLSLPAAPLEHTPASPIITVKAVGKPLSGVDLLVLFPNNTWQRVTSDEHGEAKVDLYTTQLPMTVFAASHGYTAHLEQDWRPDKGALAVELDPLPDGGSVIFPEATGKVPGLNGRLNPILDTSNRTYMYATNIAINEGQQQPVSFIMGERLDLVDARGSSMILRIVSIVGRSALVEYRSPPEADS